jgi:hypothetical protein
MKKTTIKIGTFALALVMSITSCDKDASYSLTSASDDNSTAESVFDDVYETSMDESVEMELSATAKASFGRERVGDCATITDSVIDSTTNHIIRTIDFGEEGCTVTCKGEERTKKGKIIIEKIGLKREVGSSLNVSFENFSINDYEIGGTKAISKSLNDDDQFVHTIAVNSTITNPEGNTMSWVSNRTRTILEGYDTDEDRSDDKIQIDGSSTGTNFDGENFSMTITTPLIKAAGCFFITAGVEEIAPAGKSTRTVDYGDGTCDDIANVTVDGETTEITIGSLRKKRGKKRRRLRR